MHKFRTSNRHSLTHSENEKLEHECIEWKWHWIDSISLLIVEISHQLTIYSIEPLLLNSRSDFNYSLTVSCYKANKRITIHLGGIKPNPNRY